jgi:hypothetical protein
MSNGEFHPTLSLWMCKRLVRVEECEGMCSKSERPARQLWLTPTILATEEAEIRRIKVQS